MEGRDAFDFAHRMFSRDLRRLDVNQGVLALFLSAEGKVQSIFWMFRESQGLRLFVPQEIVDSTISLIERYHFAEAFSIVKGRSLSAQWSSAAENTVGTARRSGDLFEGEWRGTRFVFGEMDSKSDEAWHLHRMMHLIPEWNTDYNESALVFDLGFEELCDLGKGCYVGQEVVERVRTRGGVGPRKLCLIEWPAEIPAGELALTDAQGGGIGSLTKSRGRAQDSKILSLGILSKNVALNTSVFLKEGVFAGRVIKAIETTKNAEGLT